VYGGSVGIYQGWSVAEEVSSDGRWTVDELTRAMQTLPPTVPVGTQGTGLGRLLT